MASEVGPTPEFESLRDELLRKHRARAVTFGLTVCSLGVLFALTFISGSVAPDSLAPRFLLVYAAHAVVNVALLLTHRRTHEMEFTAGYLKTFVLPRMRAPKRDRSSTPPRMDVAAMRSTRALGGLYALLVSAVVIVGIANGLYRSLWGIGLPLLALTGVVSAQWLFLSEAIRRPQHMRAEPQEPTILDGED